LETIARNARAQAEIIEDILDISRIITGKLRLDMRLVNPVEIIESTVESAVPAAEAKEIKLTTLLDSSAGPVYGDSNRLQQIFWNLISNALKFTPKKGKVQVRLERVNSHIEISIIDNGQGISEEFLPYVFDRFRQADSSTSRTSGGLGVGLSIVRQLIELHGGSVSVASSGEGQGSAFTVILPQAAVQTKSSTNNHQSVHPRVNEIYVPFECAPQLKDISVLIVDDEKDARELLTAILEQCGAVVYQAANITEAIQQLEKNNPDILVSDIGMPDKDGFKLIKQVREKENLEKGKRIPAVALTAYARVEDRMRTLSAGFQMHVSKPVEPAELVAVIANLTEWKM
jgi:CheY-like chemotaxis protein/two-component sensor histidine kinase